MFNRCISFLFILLGFISQAIATQPDINQKLSESIHYKQEGTNLIGFLWIGEDRPVDWATYWQIKLALDEYKKRNVIFVMMRLNTPGGELFSAMKIAELLQRFDAETGIPIVGVVYNKALSAGAMLAYSCRFLAVTPSALMGAGQPVVAGPEAQIVPERIGSALRTEYASLAKFYGRNPLIAEAMVDPDIILVKREGQIVQLNSNQEIRTQDQAITTHGRLLTLDTQGLLDLGVADLEIPFTGMKRLTPEQIELGEWPAIRAQLFAYPFFAQIPNADMIYYQNWKADFFSFLTHPIVSSLLLIGLIVCLYLAVSHGLVIPGLTGLVCLGLILFSHAMETISSLEILLITVGISLILTKIFVLPSKILAVSGMLLLILGVFSVLLPPLKAAHLSWNWHQWNLAALELAQLLAYYMTALIIALIAIVLLARFVMPRLKKTVAAGAEALSLPAVGTEGKAFTSLLPGGKIQINFRLYDALTEGEYIPMGEKVFVSKIRGNVIIVAKKMP